ERFRGEWAAGGAGGELPRLDGREVEVAIEPRDAEHVTFRFFLREATEWAPAGHEVAWQQLALRRPPRVARARGRLVRDGLARFDDLTLDGPRPPLWRAAPAHGGPPPPPDRAAGPRPRPRER